MKRKQSKYKQLSVFLQYDILKIFEIGKTNKKQRSALICLRFGKQLKT